jgi:hypothetical protein
MVYAIGSVVAGWVKLEYKWLLSSYLRIRSIYMISTYYKHMKKSYNEVYSVN